MTIDDHIQRAIIAFLQDAQSAGDMSMAQVVAAVQRALAPTDVRKAKIKANVLALVNTERVELTDALKLRLPPPPPDPAPVAAQLAFKLHTDPTKLLIIESERTDHTYYEFEDLKPKDLPRERRVNVIKILVGKKGTKDRIYRLQRSQQKFLCIGGPFDGKWKVEDEAEDYLRFNNSGGRRRAYRGTPARPSAVLVHEGAFA